MDCAVSPWVHMHGPEQVLSIREHVEYQPIFDRSEKGSFFRSCILDSVPEDGSMSNQSQRNTLGASTIDELH